MMCWLFQDARKFARPDGCERYAYNQYSLEYPIGIDSNGHGD